MRYRLTPDPRAREIQEMAQREAKRTPGKPAAPDLGPIEWLLGELSESERTYYYRIAWVHRLPRGRRRVALVDCPW